MKKPEPSSRRLWTWALLLAAAGVAARAAWYLHFKDDLFFRLGPDGGIYVTQAEGYLQGAVGDPGAAVLPNVYREVFPPGYPLFLAGIWKFLPLADVMSQREYVLATVRATQWLLAGATVLMTFALARRVLFGFSALLPPMILTASVAMVDVPNLFAYETLLAFLLTGALLLLVRASEAAAERKEEFDLAEGDHEQPETVEFESDLAAAAGDLEFEDFWAEEHAASKPRRRRTSAPGQVLIAALALSFAVLVQPRVAVILPFIAIWLWRAAPRANTAVFVIAVIVLPGAWIARDYAVYDRFVPLSINGQASLYLDNVEPIGGTGFVKGAAPPECPRSMLSANDMAEHFDWAGCMQSAGVSEIAAHPRDSVAAVGDRLAALVSPWNQRHARGTYQSEWASYHEVLPASIRNGENFRQADDLLNVLWLMLYSLLLVAGTLSLWAEGPASAARLIALPLVTLPLIHLVFHAENRFRLPALPLVAIAISLGMLWFLEKISREQTD